MRLVTRQPSPRLAPFVKSLWFYESDLGHERERILPTGVMQILVNLEEDELRSYEEREGERVVTSGGAALSGAFSHPFVIDTKEQRKIVGASFHPGGAWALFDVPCDALAEERIDLGEVWGREGGVLRERLLEARSPGAALETFEQVLLSHLRSDRPNVAVWRALRLIDAGVPVSAVAEAIGATSRQLIRSVASTTGLTPKRFGRVRRFQRALGAIVERREGTIPRDVDWADVAMSCGYFDQAHFIHEFQRLAGLRPTHYAPRSSHDRNHVPIESAKTYNTSPAGHRTLRP